MTSTVLKPLVVFLTAFALAGAGPAWSAERSEATVKKVGKAKPKPKKRAKLARKPHAATPGVPTAGTATPMPFLVATVAPVLPAAAAAGNPYLSGQPTPVGNPYLSGQPTPAGNTYSAAPTAQPAYAYQAPAGNPYMAPPAASPGYAPAPRRFGISDLLPSIPEGETILPSVKKVYPTGEKPLVVVTFKCPTELVGVTPPPTKLLHNAVTGVMDAINSTNLLSFNLQQVCQ